MEAMEKQCFYRVCLKDPTTLRGARNLDGSHCYNLPRVVQMTEGFRGKHEVLTYDSFPAMAVMTQYGLSDFFTNISISGPEDCQKGLCYDNYVPMDDMEVELAFALLGGADEDERAANIQRYEDALRSKMIRPESKGSMKKSARKRHAVSK